LGLAEQSRQNKPLLDNKLGITDGLTLVKFEGAISVITIPAALDRVRNQKKWGLRQLQTVHRTIFEPVYPWAGKLRMVDIRKHTEFAPSEVIADRVEKVFNNFHKDHAVDNDIGKGLKRLQAPEAATALAQLYNDLNVIHAFREGNGRSLRTVCTAIARQAGYDLAWSRIASDKHAFDAACVAEATGPDSPLAKIFQKIIVPLDKADDPKPSMSNRKTRRALREMKSGFKS
jgi:cell filamentation protein